MLSIMLRDSSQKVNQGWDYDKVINCQIVLALKYLAYYQNLRLIQVSPACYKN